jgi:nitrogen-specific signal transduction histidine kinase
MQWKPIEPGPGQVIIKVGVLTPTNVRISIEGADPRIPETADVLHLFETTKAHGSGLGLTIARDSAGPGGSIAFVARQPHGTIFHVDLPLHEGGM